MEEAVDTSNTKTIDIYQHMKINLKNKMNICDCPQIPEFYCIPCKVSVCKNCNFEDHKKHILISKKLEMDPSDIDKAFKETDDLLNNTQLVTDYRSVKEGYIKIVEDFTDKLKEQVERLKTEKIEEIERFFDKMGEHAEKAKGNVKEIKNKLKDYYKNSHKFYNIEGGNLDDSNTLFLLNYDLLNIANQKEKDTKTLMNNLNEDAKNYQISLDLFGKTANEEVEKILFGNSSGKNIMSDINSKLTFNADIKKDITLNDEEYNPLNHFIYTKEKMSQENYKEISDRIEKYLELIEQMQQKVSNSYDKFKSLRDIENELVVFENSKSKGADSLFSQRDEKSVNAIDPTLTLTNRSRMDRAATARNYNYSKKEDVVLNHPVLKKFFAYNMLDLYGNYFKMQTKELQSSHADLMIKVDPDEEETDYARIIENTNTIVIYEKATNRMTKKKLNLTKNPFGYTQFPIGCRCLLLKGKIYITGGRNEEKEFPNVLIYDIQEDKLKRIMDLCVPRAYHTMVYNDVFETIMVLGGENCDSVEIFDPLTNRWQKLPELNFPRSDIVFQFDKPRGMMFALFGREGTILENRYSDVIEVLDLTEFKKGWCKVEYYNRAEVSLKKFLNVFPLSNYMLLAYGGQTGRKNKRVGVLVNLMKFEIQKIDKNMKELIYCASKRSQKLSGIVANLNMDESKMTTLEANPGSPTGV